MSKKLKESKKLDKLKRFKKQELNSWLNSKIKDGSDLSRHNSDEIYYIKNNIKEVSKIKNYYTIEELIELDKILLEEKELCDERTTEKYIDLNEKIIEVYVPPRSNRYLLNKLFQEIVDYREKNNMEYKYYDVEKRHTSTINIFDITMKESFYKYCYKIVKKMEI
jgi:hypothetical protein